MSLSSWLDVELSNRGLDSSVYRDYIISLIDDEDSLRAFVVEIISDDEDADFFVTQILNGTYTFPPQTQGESVDDFCNLAANPEEEFEPERNIESTQNENSLENLIVQDYFREEETLTAVEEENFDYSFEEQDVIDFVSIGDQVEENLKYFLPEKIFSIDIIFQSIIYSNYDINIATQIIILMENHTSNSKPCRHLINNRCMKRDCTFDHDLNTIPCKYWMSTGCLTNNCPFLHQIPNYPLESFHTYDMNPTIKDTVCMDDLNKYFPALPSSSSAIDNHKKNANDANTGTQSASITTSDKKQSEQFLLDCIRNNIKISSSTPSITEDSSNGKQNIIMNTPKSTVRNSTLSNTVSMKDKSSTFSDWVSSGKSFTF